MSRAGPGIEWGINLLDHGPGDFYQFRFSSGGHPADERGEKCRSETSLFRLKEDLERAGNEANLSEQLRGEQESLQRHAFERGWCLDAKDFLSKLTRWIKLGGGNEHHVLLGDGGRAVKITKLEGGYGAQGTALNYLTNLEAQAAFLGDTIKFEGLIRIVDKGWAIVTSQRFVWGRQATPGEIDAFFVKYRMEPLGDFSYRGVYGAFEFTVRDARPANLFFDVVLRQVVSIDVQIFMKMLWEGGQ